MTLTASQTQTHISRELHVSDRELAAQAILLLAKHRSCGRIVYRHAFFKSNPPANPQDDGVLVVLVDPDSDEGNRGKIYNPRDIRARINKVREPDLPTVMTLAADAFRVMEAETRSWTPSQILPGAYVFETGANDELPAGSILFDRPDLGLRCVFQFRGKTPPSVESGQIAENPAIPEHLEQWDECGERDGYEGFDDIYPGVPDDVEDTDDRT